MRIYDLLSFRLFILIFLILTVLTIGFSLYYIKIESQQYSEYAQQWAERTSRIVTGSTKSSMLQNHKERTYAIMRSIVEQQGIEKIRLYNKSGLIVYSTDEKEISHQARMSDAICAPCHTTDGTLRDTTSSVRSNIFTGSQGYREMSYIEPIKNEKSCYEASCHAHSKSETYMGVLWVVLSLEKMDAVVQQNRARMISTNIIITLLLALAVGFFIWIWVHLPVKNMIKGTREVSSGNLDNAIKITGKDEMGVLARSFNEMTGELKKAKEEITIWSNQLENRVKEKTEELEKTQKRNLQIEKMASLGQLSATVAHELNNPIAGILTYSKLIQKKLHKDALGEDDKDSILKHLKMIETESARSGEIVKNMLLFSRQEAINVQAQQVNEIVDASINLVSHHLTLHNIHLIKDLQEDLPLVEVDENQIKQALLALYVNAVEAMDSDGTLTVKTRRKKIQNFVSVFVQDTGKGIPESVRSQIFEPFFTTKNEVKGVGLGLASVYAIVQRHGAEINVYTELEKGTTFEIRIPVKKMRTAEV